MVPGWSVLAIANVFVSAQKPIIEGVDGTAPKHTKVCELLHSLFQLVRPKKAVFGRTVVYAGSHVAGHCLLPDEPL